MRQLLRKAKRNGAVRLLSLALSLLLCLGTAVGGALTALTGAARPARNRTDTASISCQVTEAYEKADQEKRHVAVRNTGLVEAYLRATVVITWTAEDGTVLPETPTSGQDYSLELGEKWVAEDGYYYYCGAVSPGETTEDLIVCYAAVGEQTDCRLSVAVQASAVQATKSAAAAAWGMAPAADGWLETS
ncbi:MAG: hypothetical protein VB055_09010 [Oscillospiraceae bacterium]|nr:hypothetical protein [Oscillospiraceae bacterium]